MIASKRTDFLKNKDAATTCTTLTEIVFLAIVIIVFYFFVLYFSYNLNQFHNQKDPAIAEWVMTKV